ncbi:9156_t:CDS:2, partial [Entrophospora sp. SA101]
MPTRRTKYSMDVLINTHSKVRFIHFRNNLLSGIPESLTLLQINQIKIRLNKEYAEYIKKYNRYPGNAEFEISWYRKYYIPDNNNWIYYKKSQLWSRFQQRLLEIEA